MRQNYVHALLESRDTFKHLTVLRDASTLGTVGAGLTAGFCCVKGKPVERRGRKATGLKEEVPMTAGLPRSCFCATARTPFPCDSLAALHSRCTRGFSMMDGSVRGSYDINYAKSGRECHGARGRSGFGGSTCR
jgi:hypothetical protein